jgi:hypothetical protein
VRDGVVSALLKSAEPSIRWKTRVRVLGENPRSRAMRPLREEIRTSARVRALLSRRTQLGKAGTARQVYYKWQGLHWVLAALADLGYPAGDESLFPIRDRVVGFWTNPTYFREFAVKTQAEAYRQRGVPVMEGRYRRCASQQGNALRSVIALGIADERTDVLVERLLHWQWPDGGWNCDPRATGRRSSFHESLAPMWGLHEYADATGSEWARDLPRGRRLGAPCTERADHPERAPRVARGRPSRSHSRLISAPSRSAMPVIQSQVSVTITAESVPHVLLYDANVAV